MYIKLVIFFKLPLESCFVWNIWLSPVANSGLVSVFRTCAVLNYIISDAGILATGTTKNSINCSVFPGR